MNTIGLILLSLALLMFGTNIGNAAGTSDIQKEIEQLKERIQELEQKVDEQEAAAKKQAAKTEKKIEDKIGEALEERFGSLEIHGGAILYYQDSDTDELEGEKADSPSGAGFVANLEFTWRPTTASP